jgi:hypothetical protein
MTIMIPQETKEVSVFVIGCEGRAVFGTRWNGSGWSGFDNHGGYKLYEPVSISRGKNDVSLFCVGTDHALYYKHWNGSWTDFRSLFGHRIGPPAVSLRGIDTIDIFHIGRDRAIYHKSLDGQRFSDGYSRLDGKFTQVPTSVSWGPDHITLFAVGLDHALYYAQWSPRIGW